MVRGRIGRGLYVCGSISRLRLMNSFRLYQPLEAQRGHFVNYTTAIHLRIPKGDAFCASLISPVWSLSRELALSVGVSTVLLMSQVLSFSC